MYLGIEIGGTKLQLGIGSGRQAELLALERADIQPAAGATGILEQVVAIGAKLIARYRPVGIGCGFGGPVIGRSGRVVKSHQIEGWDYFPLAEWLSGQLGLPAVVANDCDAAALAEARQGAGQGQRVVLYVTVGSGIGGGLVVDGQLYQGSGTAAVEIGHLRPGLHAVGADQTVESIASGWGLAAAAQARLSGTVSHRLTPWIGQQTPLKPEAVRQRLIEAEEAAEEHAADLLERCQGEVDRLTAKMVAQAAEQGNEIAQEVLSHAVETLGWALAQAITLVAPHVVVLGGGVSLMPPALFLQPLTTAVGKYVFPPLADSFRLVAAQLGESVVVHGALELARQAQTAS